MFVVPNIIIVFHKCLLSKSGAQYNNCIPQVFILSTSGAQYNNCIAQKKDINYI